MKIEQIKSIDKEPAITKRPALPTDTEFARNVHHSAYHDVIVKQFGSWDERRQDVFFENDWSDGAAFQILLSDDVPCGYYKEEDFPDRIIPHELVLLPGFQGKGIGTKILSEVIDRAASRNVPVKIRALRENRALNLYRKLGFQDVGSDDTHIELEFVPRHSQKT